MHWRDAMDELAYLTPEKTTHKLKTIFSGEVDFDMLKQIRQNAKPVEVATEGSIGPVSG